MFYPTDKSLPFASSNTSPQSRSNHSNHTQPLKTWANRLLNHLAGNSDPIITQHFTSDHQTQWQVYDPFTQTTHTFATKIDVMTWLEQRHNH
jgi:hypothetical protein